MTITDLENKIHLKILLNFVETTLTNIQNIIPFALPDDNLKDAIQWAHNITDSEFNRGKIEFSREHILDSARESALDGIEKERQAIMETNVSKFRKA